MLSNIFENNFFCKVQYAALTVLDDGVKFVFGIKKVCLAFASVELLILYSETDGWRQRCYEET